LAEFRFRPKKASFKPKPSLRQKPLEKERLVAPRNNDRRTVGDKCTGSFEPLDLFTNKSSSFWREQNLKAWFKEQESYEDQRYVKAYLVDL
jgi:hypothetical protein